MSTRYFLVPVKQTVFMMAPVAVESEEVEGLDGDELKEAIYEASWDAEYFPNSELITLDNRYPDVDGWEIEEDQPIEEVDERNYSRHCGPWGR